MEWILIYIIPFLLASDTFFLSISGGVTLRPFKWIQAFKIAFIFTIVLAFSAMMAFYLGHFIKSLITDFSSVIAHILILFVGIRLINDARKIKNEERTYLLEDLKILLTSALAASFIVFLAFLGLGLMQSGITPLIYIFAIAVFALSILGIFIGSYYQPLRLGRSSKFASGLLMAIFIIIHYINHL